MEVRCMAVAQKSQGPAKNRDFYPPLAPRELGVYVARIAYAPTLDDKRDARRELYDKLADFKKSGESQKSVRYIEHVLNAMEKEILKAQAELDRLFRDKQMIMGRSESSITLINKSEVTKSKIAEDKYAREVDELSKKKNLISPSSVVGYVGTSAAVLATVLTAIWEAIGSWAVGWKVSASTAAIATALAVVSRMRKHFSNKIQTAADNYLNAAEKIASDALGLHEALRKQEQDQLKNIAKNWNDFVKKSAVSCALHCFDIAMDFFPDYVREELSKLSLKQFDFGQKIDRKEALSLLKNVLEADGAESLNLHLNG